MFQLDLKIHSIFKKQFVNLLKIYLQLYWNKLILQKQHNLYVFYFNRSISLFFIRQAVLISTALPKYSKISWCDDIIYAHLFLLPFRRNLSLQSKTHGVGWRKENSEGGYFLLRKENTHMVSRILMEQKLANHIRFKEYEQALEIFWLSGEHFCVGCN